MLFLLSPAKSLDFSSSSISETSHCQLLQHSEELINQLRLLKQEDIETLMKVSSKIAQLNVERFQNFSQPNKLDEHTKQAMLCFDGTVYKGLNAIDFSMEEITYAQKHVGILSGLYGFLRPLDIIKPYRLEMGTKFMNKRGKNLYEFWGGLITDQINTQTESSGIQEVVNLASKEYFKAVKPKKLSAELININFKEKRNGQYKVIAFNAKKARGLMTRFAIKQQLEDIQDLKKFDLEEYSFNTDLSTDKDWLFTRG